MGEGIKLGQLEKSKGMREPENGHCRHCIGSFPGYISEGHFLTVNFQKCYFGIFQAKEEWGKTVLKSVRQLEGNPAVPRSALRNSWKDERLVRQIPTFSS